MLKIQTRPTPLRSGAPKSIAETKVAVVHPGHGIHHYITGDSECKGHGIAFPGLFHPTLLKRFSPNSNGNSQIQVIEILKNNESLVRAIFGASPPLRTRRVEKVCHQTVRVTRHGILSLEHTSPLKFSKTFEFIPRKTTQEIQNFVSVDRSCVAKEGTHQRRARGDSGQI